MTANVFEPQEVIELVERYVMRELRDTEEYENRSAFDADGVWVLHELAREIYARGVTDGAAQEAERARHQSQRERTAAAMVLMGTRIAENNGLVVERERP